MVIKVFSILPPLHLHIVLNSLRSDTIYKVNPNVCHNSPIISIVDPDQLEFLLKKKKILNTRSRKIETLLKQNGCHIHIGRHHFLCKLPKWYSYQSPSTIYKYIYDVINNSLP